MQPLDASAAAGMSPGARPGEVRAGSHGRDLALLSAAHAVTHFQPALYPMVFPFAMRSLGFGYAQLGLLISATNLVGGLLQGVHGWLSRWVKRKALCGGGNILLGFALALSGLAGSFGSFGFGRLLSSVAASPQHPMASSLMSDWFDRERRGSAFAVHFSGGNVGTLVTPLLAGFLIARVGWRETLMLFGIPGVVVGLLFWLLAEDRRGTDPLPVPWRRRPRADAAPSPRVLGARGKPYLAAIRDPKIRLLLVARGSSSPTCRCT
jgi:MFS family permease